MEAKGFTLLEVLLTISILGILAGLSLPLASSLLVRHEVDIATATFTQNLRRAQILSQSGAQDSQWGAFIQAGIVTLYKGASYATRDNSYDEITQVSSSLTLSGDTDIVFSKIFGNPPSAKTTTLASGTESLTVTLNAYGLVSY